MSSAFDEVFMFLIDLAWESRFTIPMIVTSVLLATGISLQIEINFGSHQTENEDMEDEEEYSEYDDESFEDESYADADTGSFTSTSTLTDVTPTSDLEADYDYSCSSLSSYSSDYNPSSPASNGTSSTD